MEKRNQRIPADDELKSQKATQAKLPKEVARLPHRHEPGLHPDLEPPCALAKPTPDIRRRRLVRRGIDHSGPVAKPCKAHAEICIFRHIVSIPSADFAQDFSLEMI